MTVESAFSIDTSEIRRKIYYKYSRAGVDLLVPEMRTAFQDIGKIAQHEANVLITGGEESKLAKASKITVKEFATSIETVVDWNGALSAAGFPYGAAVNTGRKAFGPVTASVLRFEIDGKVIFAKRVKAFPGLHYTSKGLTNARPKIVARVALMRRNVVRKLNAATP